MDRAALLMEVAKAASASALGKDISNDLRKLDGKRFEVRIRFGCAPPASPPERREDNEAGSARTGDRSIQCSVRREGSHIAAAGSPGLDAQ